MPDIPVTFEHNGVQYTGHLSPVHGAGQNIWHLYVNKYYFGRLRYHHDWVFDSIRVPEIASQLGEFVIAWRQ